MLAEPLIFSLLLVVVSGIAPALQSLSLSCLSLAFFVWVVASGLWCVVVMLASVVTVQFST